MTTTVQPQTVTYDPSAAIALAHQAQQSLTAAKDYVIDSDNMLELASEDLRTVKGLQKTVEEKRTAITVPLNQALKAVNDLFRAPKEYLDQAETVLKRAITTYQMEQQRKAAEAKRIADEAARVERERLAAIEREQQEAARRAQEEAQAAAAAGDLEAAQRAQAEADAAAMQATAAALTAQVVTVAPTVQAAPKVSGISTRTTYSAQVTDLMELVKAVAEGKAPIEAIQADTKFLGAQARAFKKAGQLYPGVMAVADTSVAARAA